jgi:hypothetical protein
MLPVTSKLLSIFLIFFTANAKLTDIMAHKRVASIVANSGNRLFTSYCKQLESRPLVTKCITSGAISLFADVTCQKLENAKKKLDLNRILKL